MVGILLSLSRILKFHQVMETLQTLEMNTYLSCDIMMKAEENKQ